MAKITLIDRRSLVRITFKMKIGNIIYLNCGERYEFDWSTQLHTQRKIWFMIDYRSDTHNLSSCEMKAWKKFRPEPDTNPWPPRYRCSALPTKLSSHLGTTLWVRNIPVDCEWGKFLCITHNLLSSCEIKALLVMIALIDLFTINITLIDYPYWSVGDKDTVIDWL